jgi:hypothetical protein
MLLRAHNTECLSKHSKQRKRFARWKTSNCRVQCCCGAAVPSAGRVTAGDSSSRWLDPQQELLLPLEMGQLIARFQEYIQHQLMQNAWVKLEQVGAPQAVTLQKADGGNSVGLQEPNYLCFAVWQLVPDLYLVSNWVAVSERSAKPHTLGLHSITLAPASFQPSCTAVVPVSKRRFLSALCFCCLM